jgi:hypothetical protein
MAVSYTAVYEGTFGSGGLTTGSFSCTSGRLLLAYVQAITDQIAAQVGTVFAASGWTPVTGSDNSASPGWGYASRLFYKTAASSSESLTAVPTWSGTGVTQYAKVTVLELNGQDGTTPFRQVAKDTVDQAETTSTNFTFASAPLSDSLVLAFMTLSSNGGTQTLGPGPSGGFTEDHESGVADWIFTQWQHRTGSTSTTVDWATSAGLAGAVDVAIEIANAAGGGSNTTITPNTGAITTTGVAAQVATNFARIAAIGALALSGLAPSVLQSLVRAPTTGSASLTGIAPVVTQQSYRTPQVGSLSLAGIQPSVTNSGSTDTLRTPTTGSAVLTGIAPVVTQQSFRTATLGALALTGSAPSVTQGLLRSPTTGSLSLVGIAPSVGSVAAITPATASLAFTGFAVTQGLDVPPPAPGVLSLTGIAPVVTQQQGGSIAPSTGSLSLTGLAPVVTLQSYRTPIAGSLSLVGIAPSVAATVTITPQAGSLSLAGKQVGVGVVGTVSPFSGALALTGNAPSITQVDTRTPTGAGLSLVGSSPLVTQASISRPSVAALSFSGAAPLVSTFGSTVIVPGAAVLALSGQSASASNSGRLEVPQSRTVDVSITYRLINV